VTTINELIEGLEQVDIDNLDQVDIHAIDKVIDFLGLLPQELDTASGIYYLRKERDRNDTGVDYRVEIHTYDAEQVDYDATYPDDYEY